MSKTLPRKALIAISSFNGAIYPGGHKTGLFLTEALHPYEVFVAAVRYFQTVVALRPNWSVGYHSVGVALVSPAS